MPDPKSRARVERLLRGEFHSDDLTGLFLYARDHCDGRESVADIGHFVAHHHERDKGIITRSTAEWFAVAGFHAAKFSPDGLVKWTQDRLPPATRDYFKIAVNLFDAKAITSATGMRKARASSAMQRMVQCLVRNSDGTWALPIGSCTEEEARLFEFVVSRLVVKSAFSEEQLFIAWMDTLKSNGLITKDEARTHSETLRPLVSLYAIAAMHNCIVQIGDGTTVQLKAACNIKEKLIGVGATVPLAPPHGNYTEGVSLTTYIYEVFLDPTVHCHPDLLVVDSWNFEIEVGTDRRLRPLR